MKEYFLKLLEQSLTFPAKYIIKRFHPKIIAVTGSVGKSSTKEAIYFLLYHQLKEKIAKSHQNLNTKLGLPLAIFGFKKSPDRLFFWPFYVILVWLKTAYILLRKNYPQILVLEISADLPGDIKKICKWLKVNVAVYTRIGPVHLEFFKDTRGVFNEKKDLAESLSKNDFLILNKKDPWSKNIEKISKAKTIYYEYQQFDLPQSVAKAVGRLFNINSADADEILKNFKSLKGRLQVIKKNQITIIDDSYNANPTSTNLALDLLEQTEGKRKIAFLGDMLELGDYTEKGHQIIANRAKKVCDIVVFVGPIYKKFKKHANFWFENSYKAAKNLPIKLKKDDVVLIKGSRGIKMETIIYKINKIISRKNQ